MLVIIRRNFLTLSWNVSYYSRSILVIYVYFENFLNVKHFERLTLVIHGGSTIRILVPREPEAG